MRIALIAVLTVMHMCLADDANRCYFIGEVDWDNADFAVVQVSSNDGTVIRDSLHLSSPGTYSIPEQEPWWSNYFIEANEYWRVDCWLMLHGSSVPVPQSHSYIYFPDDFYLSYGVYYCVSDFGW